jgi:hypothetical protein
MSKRRFDGERGKRMKNFTIALICCIGLSFCPIPGVTQTTAPDPIPSDEDMFSRDIFSEERNSSEAETSDTPKDDLFSEDDIFSDDTTVIAVEEHQDERIAAQLMEESVSFAGEFRGRFIYDITRGALEGDTDWGDNPYAAIMEGDFLLDARWREGIKVFGDLWAAYTESSQPAEQPQPNQNIDDDKFETILKEFFGDMNITRKVYFRFGKQNLKWGRGYFWNPTDLISEDRKDFQDLDRRREGVFGLKMHIPFGTRANFYGFIDMNDVEKSEDFAYAGKFEFLVFNDVEVAFSAWTKNDYRPVFGFDFSTYEFRTQWRGEASLTKGGNQTYLEKQGDEYVETYDSEEWIPRFTLGCTRNFDVGDFTNRFSVTGEFFYNAKGYDVNMFEDDEIRERFLSGGYYNPNYYGKYYAAIFTTFGRFLNNSDLTLTTNAIGNLSDSSFILEADVGYQLTFNARLHTKLSGYLGEKNREYTFSGNAVSAEVSFTFTF